MKKYRLLMHGRNFLLNRDGEIGRYGFYQNFFLESPDLNQAKRLVTSMIRLDKKLTEVTLNKVSDPPRINLETYWELDSFDYVGNHLNTDRTLYKEKKWWQFWK
ncbi:MAG: hypothetical protein LC633_03480 [Desulfobulbaceae bacterium]|nr:hypothetical protein [Desulfobulbaceae bacterium]